MPLYDRAGCRGGSSTNFRGAVGGRGRRKEGRSPEKNCRSYVQAVFDLKPTYNHQIFITVVQSHSPKFHFGRPVGAKPLTGEAVWSPWPSLEPPLAAWHNKSRDADPLKLWLNRIRFAQRYRALHKLIDCVDFRCSFRHR